MCVIVCPVCSSDMQYDCPFYADVHQSAAVGMVNKHTCKCERQYSPYNGAMKHQLLEQELPGNEGSTNTPKAPCPHCQRCFNFSKSVYIRGKDAMDCIRWTLRNSMRR